MAPAINSYVVLFTVPSPPATEHYIYGVDVCNGGAARSVIPHTGSDAHISIYIVNVADGWSSGEPPVFSRVAYNQLVECDGTDGNAWVGPVKHLNPGDRVVVFTDTANVTFYGHGFQYT